MKKIIGIITLLLVVVGAKAQNDYYGPGHTKFGQVINGDGWLRPEGGKESKNGSYGDNIVKIKLDGLAALKIGLGYERVINPKVTFNIDALYQIPTTSSSDFLDFDALYDQLASAEPALGDTISSLFPDGRYGLAGAEVNRFYVMPEFRYYFKEAPKGFYAGLYFKYREYSYTNKFEYKNEGTQEAYDYNIDFNMNTASAGLSLGMQTFLSKTISLDILFFGIQYGSNIGTIDLTPNNVAISQDIQDGVSTAVDFINTELPIKDILRTTEISDAKIALESRFSSPSIRLPSLRLGIRF